MALCKWMSSYEKGVGNAFATTCDRLETATQRARAMAAKFSPHTDPEPFTAMHELVTMLTTFRT